MYKKQMPCFHPLFLIRVTKTQIMVYLNEHVGWSLTRQQLNESVRRILFNGERLYDSDRLKPNRRISLSTSGICYFMYYVCITDLSPSLHKVGPASACYFSYVIITTWETDNGGGNVWAFMINSKQQWAGRHTYILSHVWGYEYVVRVVCPMWRNLYPGKLTL